MTMPTVAVVTTNLDASTDSPASARTDLLDAVQKLNQIIAHISAFAGTLLDDASAPAARATLGSTTVGDAVFVAATAAAARAALVAAASGANSDITSLTALAAGGLPDGSVTTPDIAAAAVTPAKLSQPLTLGTSVATTSGTSIDFASIPAWVSRITLSLAGVSTNGANHILFQLGSAGIKTTGYLSTAQNLAGGPSLTTGTFTAGFGVLLGAASCVIHGQVVLTKCASNQWVFSQNISRSDGAIVNFGAGSATLTGALDTVRMTTVGGTDAFDAGAINILYE